METHCSYISYEETGYFSKLIIDYLDNEKALQPFYNFRPQIENIEAIINQRKDFKHRNVLVEELQKQYQGLELSLKVSNNLQSLSSNNTFTITTAHQPNIFTGPLYVVYKIFHVVKLGEELKQKFPQYNFVPVYFMGSEDADLDELNNITLNERKYLWQTKQTGAVGRMKVDKALIQLINELEGQLSVLPHGNELMEIFRASYKEKTSIQQATLQLLNTLFGEYGLVVLIPDNAALKKVFHPIIQKELTEQFSHKAVSDTTKRLSEHYKVQASGREINLFYLIDDKRERIEVEGLKFKVQGLKLEWTQDEILKELEEHPERFSPNVILRGAFQETILPNIIFVGGGGELAYWLELKEVFQQANIPYPMLVLRNSFLFIENKIADKVNQLEFADVDLFKDENALMKQFTQKHSNNKTSLNGEFLQTENLYDAISSFASKIDKTLTQHIEALKKKTIKGLSELEKKMLRAEKKKFITEQAQIHKIKSLLFPNNSLQERIENFSVFYSVHGKSFFEDVFLNSKGFNQQFCIFRENKEN
ncbi:MAG: bacillithiol biosynthesis cysteine-adding enzyme BshC [Parafilimonas sp.]